MLAEILNVDFEVLVVTETTALGAANLAELQTGFFDSTKAISQLWLKTYTYCPTMEPELRNRLLEHGSLL